MLDPLASNLHEENRRLRDIGPAAQIALPGGVPAWAITDQGLARRLMLDPRVSKDPRQHWPAYRNGEIPTDWPLRIWVDIRNALSTYGEEHGRLRRVIAPFFNSHRVRALIPDIEQITSNLLDDLAMYHPGPVDVRRHFAWRMPLDVINLILGLPEEMTDRLRHLVEANMRTHYTDDEAAESGRAYYALLNELVAVKRRTPGTDLTSHLVQLNDADELSHQELLDSIMLVIGAGHETTADLLDQTITNLLRHPEQLDKVRSGAASWDDAVEETLRHESPAGNVPLRFAVEEIHDVETGTTIPQGDVIVVNLAAVGRDPLVHHKPDIFDVGRPSRSEHTSFGHGVHFCLGALLARTEARIGIRALFTRFPGLSFAEPATTLLPLASFITNGHQSLPVTLG
ncbi:cytochrome P450 [Streptomyces sp. NPDC051644]|uniref:cytochrome P450 n=1 Tax=Streptomyces sp. NPDC051644 TaxID=3365666 RepID=UPI00379E19B9